MKWGRQPGLGPGFRLIWAAVVVSSLGSGMRYVALPLLAAELTADPRKVALVYLAGQLPWPLVMLYAGAAADRFDRRRLMCLVDVARAAVALGVAIAIALGETRIFLLMAVAALLDLGQRFYSGAWAGIVPTVVAPSGRNKANAAVQGGSVTALMLIGNPVGALLFDVDVALPFFFDAASFAVAALLILMLKGDYRARQEGGDTVRRPGLPRQIADGIRELWGQSYLRRIVLLAALYNVVGASQIAISVLYAKHTLGLGNTAYGLLVAAFGLGSLIASLLEERLVLRVGRGRLLLAALVAASAAALGLGLSGNRWAAGVFTLLYGASMSFWTVTVTTVRQDLVPGEFMGRVTMTYKTIVRAAATVGSATGGIIAHGLDLRWVFVIGSALLFAGVLTGGRMLLRTPGS